MAKVATGAGMSIEGTVFEESVLGLISSIKPKRIIETGTYLGNGSTEIIARSLATCNITDYEFYTIECNLQYYQRAKLHLQSFPKIKLIHALSLPRNLLPKEDELRKELIENVKKDDIWVDHPEEQRVTKYFQETDFPNIPDDALGRILKSVDGCVDLMMLDSGGHLGLTEFTYSLSKIKTPCHFVLDDIFHVKHHQTWKFIKQSTCFEVLKESKEKFGFGITKYNGKLFPEVTR